MPNGSDIIIRGGSAEVEFDTNTFPPETPGQGHKKFKNATKKITRVQITGDITFDSQDSQGIKCEIWVHCE